jgi:Lrp/AsnC family transcriptional regulator for asnA, asnC and gidA
VARSAERKPFEMDDIDKAIVAELQRDGRLSYQDLAVLVNLSPPAVRQRVQRLLTRGGFQVVAVTDPTTLGYPVMAMIGLRTEGSAREAADRIAELEEVIYVVLTAGSFDVVAEVVCVDTEQLMHVVDEHIKAVPGVHDVEIMIELAIHTHRFTWRPR